MASGTENAYSLLAGGVPNVEAQANALDGDDLRAERRPASSIMVWGIEDYRPRLRSSLRRRRLEN